MTDERIDNRRVDFVDSFSPGVPPPTGYLDWHEWARVQDKAGLRQKTCTVCGRYRFPQELDGAKCKGGCK